MTSSSDVVYSGNAVFSGTLSGFDTLYHLNNMEMAFRADFLYHHTTVDSIRGSRFFDQVHLFHTLIGDEADTSLFSRDCIAILTNTTYLLRAKDFDEFTRFAFDVTNYIVKTTCNGVPEFTFAVSFPIATPKG